MENTMPQRQPRLILGSPVVVSRAPVGLTNWGPWQFPSIMRTADGSLHVSYHVQADSAKAYGLPVAHAISTDGGQSWQALADAPHKSGILLPNGDRLCPMRMRSLPVDGLSLPAPLGIKKGSYGSVYHVFRLEDLPNELRDGWRFTRLPDGETQWREEKATVSLPGEVRYVAVEPSPESKAAADRGSMAGGVFTFPSAWRLCLAPDGSLWDMNYGFRAPGGRLNERWSCALLRSTDYGHTWSMASDIAYDAAWGEYDGFTEPNIAFLPGGDLLCFLRTTDGHGIGPMYCCRSHDNGQNWSTPRIFDDLGVWPATLTLAGGATLVSYGRPGLFVRASLDPAGDVWGERVAVREPLAYQTDTCSYSDLIALDDHTALIVYSDFQYPDEQGQKRKTILVRALSIAP
jgi:hypothetical protein